FLPRHRQRKAKKAALPRLAFGLDNAAMRLKNGLGDGEAQSGAAPSCARNLHKPLEDARQILRRDADARILHPKLDARFDCLRRHAYAPPLRRMAPGVIEQVD